MTTRRTVPVVLALAAMMTVLAARMARRTGASPAEARVPRPGDTLLPRADLQYDRARTLAAPPAEVWPVALPDGTPGTRLHLRERYETGGLVERAAVRLTGVVSAVMTWRMLGRLAVLVTGAPAHPSGWSGPGVPLGSRRPARCLAGWSAQRR